MLSLTERHQLILQKLHQEGHVKVVDLCKTLDVSSVTIRKDLKLLEEKGLLFRNHGGAMQHNPYAADRPVNEKEKINSDEKSRIAQKAADMIVPNDCILIASGTTVQYFAKHIHPNFHFTVLTASLNVAQILNTHPEIEVLQLGGVLRKSSSSVTGFYAEKILEDFACSKLFLGVDGIDLEFGLSTTNTLEAHLNRKMIQCAQKTILLADSSKFGKRGYGRICGIEEIDQIITDKNISQHQKDSLLEMGIELTIV
ncbi:DeoR/GlpR family DNA-binding transcription regulator [Gynurincola endophyticus]|jgi:DeoR family transcriptional regulator of aga operon|uniref:DeoR/GlpR family DNA-binding transcription regulator n=1 Tax=Gynurincola endophyticus TaxID=2479004 RepID=UPI000F8F13C4|nr:DeoR/GlpR family DNA-binding transcription regulator [Gynurincola endophyticus]